MSWTGKNNDAISAALRTFKADNNPNNEAQVASAYYSAVGTYFAMWKHTVWKLGYLYQSLLHAKKSMHHAELAHDTFMSYISDGYAYNPERAPSADSIDILCTIFWRLGKKHYRGRAVDLLMFCSQKKLLQGAKAHTRAFILMHNVRFNLNPFTQQFFFKSVCSLAVEVESEATRVSDEGMKILLYGQTSRIWRNLGEFMPKESRQRAYCLGQASECARLGRVSDQLLKAKY
jgi:hypothetical protein